MKMYFDKFSEIGSTHKENEDFAVLGDEEHPFVIVSDGCSGSKETGTGSRILSLCMADIMKDHGFNFTHYMEGVGYNAAFRADTIRKGLGLERESLDATLIIAFADQYKVSISAWGDGEIIIGREDHIESISISYTEEIPYYLSYRLYLDRDKQYNEMATSRQLFMKINDRGREVLFSPTYIYQANIDRVGLNYILISTDGMNSFINKDNNPVDQNMVNGQITSFKRLNGEFIGRRVNRMMKENAKEGITHYDDFTVAGISFVNE
jgi:hypothetical protein